MTYLTHTCRMYFSILIKWTSPFPILGSLGDFFFICIQILKELLLANSIEPDQTPRFVASDLVLTRTYIFKMTVFNCFSMEQPVCCIRRLKFVEFRCKKNGFLNRCDWL